MTPNLSFISASHLTQTLELTQRYYIYTTKSFLESTSGKSVE